MMEEQFNGPFYMFVLQIHSRRPKRVKSYALGLADPSDSYQHPMFDVHAARLPSSSAVVRDKRNCPSQYLNQ